jgi:hypothetical protein
LLLALEVRRLERSEHPMAGVEARLTLVHHGGVSQATLWTIIGGGPPLDSAEKDRLGRRGGALDFPGGGGLSCGKGKASLQRHDDGVGLPCVGLGRRKTHARKKHARKK